MDPERIREALKHMDPKDPDPEHWYIYIILQIQRQKVIKKSRGLYIGRGKILQEGNQIIYFR
jgi:hypothetical protein